MAFFQSGDHDYVCIGKEGRIVASGTLIDMLNKGDENNYAVGKLTPLRYKTHSVLDTPYLNDELRKSLDEATISVNAQLRKEALAAHYKVLPGAGAFAGLADPLKEDV